MADEEGNPAGSSGSTQDTVKNTDQTGQAKDKNSDPETGIPNGGFSDTEITVENGSIQNREGNTNSNAIVTDNGDIAQENGAKSKSAKTAASIKTTAAAKLVVELSHAAKMEELRAELETLRIRHEVKCGAKFTSRNVTVFSAILGIILLFRNAIQSYFIAVSHEIRDRYFLPKGELEFAMGLEKSAFVVSLIFTSYYGNKIHKPVFTLIGSILVAGGAILCASPYFLLGPRSVDSVRKVPSFYEAGLCIRKETNNTADYSSQCLQEPGSLHPEENHLSYMFLCFGQILIGLGSSFMATLGFIYIEEAERKELSPLLIGIILAMHGAGELLGVLLSYGVAEYPEDLQGVVLIHDFGITAWWLGLPILAVCIVVVACVMLMFPRFLREPKWLLYRRWRHIRREEKRRLEEARLKHLMRRKRQRQKEKEKLKKLEEERKKENASGVKRTPSNVDKKQEKTAVLKASKHGDSSDDVYRRNEPVFPSTASDTDEFQLSNDEVPDSGVSVNQVQIETGDKSIPSTPSTKYGAIAKAKTASEKTPATKAKSASDRTPVPKTKSASDRTPATKTKSASDRTPVPKSKSGNDRTPVSKSKSGNDRTSVAKSSSANEGTSSGNSKNKSAVKRTDTPVAKSKPPTNIHDARLKSKNQSKSQDDHRLRSTQLSRKKGISSRSAGEETNDEEEEKIRHKQKEAKRQRLGRRLSDLPQNLWYLLTKPLFSVTVLASTLASFIQGGQQGTTSIYLQTVFFYPVTNANTISGVIHGLGFAVGSLIGGYCIYRWKLEFHKQMMLLRVLLAVCAVALFLTLPIENCPGRVYGNENGTDYSTELGFQLDQQCTSRCDCTWSQYEPICDVHGTIYMSPCFAGCANAKLNNLRHALEYHDCKCSGHKILSSRFCKYGCTLASAYIILMLIATTSHAFGSTTIILILIRGVPEKLRALSLGFALWIGYLIAVIPGNAIYNALRWSACLIHREDCHEEDKCWLYDTSIYRYSQHLLTAVLEIVAMILFFITDMVMEDVQKLKSVTGALPDHMGQKEMAAAENYLEQEEEEKKRESEEKKERRKRADGGDGSNNEGFEGEGSTAAANVS